MVYHIDKVSHRLIDMIIARPIYSTTVNKYAKKKCCVDKINIMISQAFFDRPNLYYFNFMKVRSIIATRQNARGTVYVK